MNQVPQEKDEDPAFQNNDDGTIAAVNDGEDGANADVEYPMPHRKDNYTAPDPAPFVLRPTMPLDHAILTAFLNACMPSKPRVTYKLGKKVPHHGAVPGLDFTQIDCSGFVREAIRLATDPMVKFPDGSVVQREWVQRWNYAAGSVDDGNKTDGRVRIAFLRPQDSEKGVGHVVLLLNGRTLESHGGVGPDSQAWNKLSWRRHALVYLLD